MRWHCFAQCIILHGINGVISTFIVVTNVGCESMTCTLLTAVSNLSSPFGASIYKSIDSCFDAHQDDIVRDDMHVRWQVAHTFVIVHGVKLCSLFWLVLLPSQKTSPIIKATWWIQYCRGQYYYFYICIVVEHYYQHHVHCAIDSMLQNCWWFRMSMIIIININDNNKHHPQEAA